MDVARCPARQELENLLDERLTPTDLRRVSAHVAGCPECQNALDGLTADAGSGPSSWRGEKDADSSPPNPVFLDRIKQALPATQHPGPAPNASTAAAHPAEGDEAEAFPDLPDYKVLEVLGRGGEGVVYKARHRPLARLVALKMLRDTEHAQPQALARFRLEAETLARLHHPNIVQVYEVGSAGGRPFFAMEYVEGGNLSARLRGQPQPARESAALVEALARAVHAAHQAGVIHRDLKPANVLLAERHPGEPFGTPKVTDFGLAKRVQVDSSLTRTGMVLGTPGYMAPEQARAEGKEVGPACDVYALGSILYHLLTGRPPFVGSRSMDVLLQVVHDEPVSVRRLFPQAPRDLETICLKCLQKEPRRRYATAEALAEDLRRYLDGRSVLARPTPVWERGWKAARRRPVIATLIAACTVALLLLLGGGAYYNSRLTAAVKKADEKALDASRAEQKAGDEAAAARAAEKKKDDEAAAARTAEKHATDEAAAARAAEQTAQASAAEAERQRGLTLAAYDKLVFEVQDRLGHTAATQAMRQSLLKTAADGLKEMAKGMDAAPDRVRAAALMKAGRILYTISDDEGAAAQFKTCRDIALDLLKANPRDGQARDLLCQAYSGFANLAARAGRSWEASANFNREADCAKDWYDDEPANPAARERLAESYDWLAGDVPSAIGPTASEDYSKRLLALVEPWSKADPKNPIARYYRAAAQNGCGRIRLAKGDPVGARDCFLQSKALMDGLIAESPNEPKYTNSLMSALQALAGVCVELGEPGKALPYATAEAECYRHTLESGINDPNNVEFQWQCGEAFVTRAAVLMRLMRHDEAVQELTAAAERFRALQPKLQPGVLATKVRDRLPQVEEELAFCKAVPLAVKDPAWALRQQPAACQDLLIIRVCLLMQQGRIEEAQKAAELVDDLKPATIDDCLSLARFLSGDTGGLTAGKETAAYADAERAMRQRFMDRALAALKQAADLGFRDAARLKADDDLWVLRQEPAFQTLVERLEKTP